MPVCRIFGLVCAAIGEGAATSASMAARTTLGNGRTGCVGIEGLPVWAAMAAVWPKPPIVHYNNVSALRSLAIWWGGAVERSGDQHHRARALDFFDVLHHITSVGPHCSRPAYPRQ